MAYIYDFILRKPNGCEYKTRMKTKVSKNNNKSKYTREDKSMDITQLSGSFF